MRFPLLPFRHHFGLELDELLRVVSVNQVTQFMDDDVLDARLRSLYQFGVQDNLSLRRAASPTL